MKQSKTNVNHKHFRPQHTLETRKMENRLCGGENWTISGGENSGHRRNMEEPFNNSICKQKLFVMLPSKEGMWGKERSCDINKSFAITAEAGSLLGNFPFCLSPIHLVLIQLARLTLSCGHPRGGGAETIEPKSLFHSFQTEIKLKSMTTKKKPSINFFFEATAENYSGNYLITRSAERWSHFSFHAIKVSSASSTWKRWFRNDSECSAATAWSSATEGNFSNMHICKLPSNSLNKLQI